MKAEHLGDGAYISESDEGVFITANHHDPNEATDVVHIDMHGVAKLIEKLTEYMEEHK